MTSSEAHGFGFDVGGALNDLRTEGRGIPHHCYTSDRIFELENAGIFGAAWSCFAPLQKLQEPGSIVVGDVGRTPILVTRTTDGNIHGFINACRHRGYPLADASTTNCKKLTCRYHSWTYRLDGSLVVAPDTDGTFDRSEHGLLPVSVDTWGQFVFVNPEPNAPPLNEALPMLGGMAQKYNFCLSLDDYDLVEETLSHQGANWKLWWDNACECYHCPTIHGESFAAAFLSTQEAYTFEPHGLMTVTAIEPKDIDGNDKPATSFHLFPGAHIVQQKDLMIMARVIPDGPRSYTVHTHYFAEKGANPDDVANWIELWKQTYEEDKLAVQLQQRSLESGLTKQFRYVPKREFQPMHHMGNVLMAYEKIEKRQVRQAAE